MKEILRTLVQDLQQRRNVVLCSLVETRGSTPQKAGAWMLVYPDGSQYGTLGGGCVEAEVKRKALALEDRSEILTFDLDDNYGWDDGLICGGRMRVLADPLGDARDAAYFGAFRALLESGCGCTEAVVIDPSRAGVGVGCRALYDAEGNEVARHSDAQVPPAIQQSLQGLSSRPRPYIAHGAAYLPVLPRCRLVIVGAGHVGLAVAKLAAEADFDIWVCDDRAGFANQERFPTAERLVVGDVDEILPSLETDLRTFAIIVTRGHAHDEQALFHLAKKPLGYLGMIGSKRKIRLIFDDLEAVGIDRKVLDQVHAPLGIHIGSRTVPEIAIAIVAELIAHRNLGGTQHLARHGHIARSEKQTSALAASSESTV